MKTANRPRQQPIRLQDNQIREVAVLMSIDTTESAAARDECTDTSWCVPRLLDGTITAQSMCDACYGHVHASMMWRYGQEMPTRPDRSEITHTPADPTVTELRAEAERLGAVLTDYRWLLAVVGEALSLPEAATQSDAEQQRRQLMEARAVSALAAVWSVITDGALPGNEAELLRAVLSEQQVCYATAGEPVTS